MRRFLDLPLQVNFINKRIYLLYISLKTSALLKQEPLFVPIYCLNITVTYIVYGNMCSITGALSGSYSTVYGQ